MRKSAAEVAARRAKAADMRAKGGPATMPSEKAIEDAKKLLERAGYLVM